MSRLVRRVLIVEDDDTTRRALLLLLDRAGYHATAAASLQEARRELAAGDIGLLIADVRLGAYNGLNLLVTNPHPVPSIVVTGYADAVLEAEAHRLNADFLVKPFEPAELLGLVAAKLGLHGDRSPAFEVPRRWERKPLVNGLPAQIHASSARVLDISYGGLRLEFEEARWTLPQSFEVKLLPGDLAVQVDLVWKSRTVEGNWLCGAALSQVNAEAIDAWHALVDAL